MGPKTVACIADTTSEWRDEVLASRVRFITIDSTFLGICMIDLAQLYRDRESLQFALTLEMVPDLRAILQALLVSIEGQIVDLERRRIN